MYKWKIAKKKKKIEDEKHKIIVDELDRYKDSFTL